MCNPGFDCKFCASISSCKKIGFAIDCITKVKVELRGHWKGKRPKARRDEHGRKLCSNPWCNNLRKPNFCMCVTCYRSYMLEYHRRWRALNISEGRLAKQAG